MDRSERRRLPLLVVLSGPSGVGKDSVMRHLRTRVTGIRFAVSVTTRPPRPGEVPGKSYTFVSRTEYDRLLDAGELLAPAEVHGNWYGVPVDEVRNAFASDEDALLKIDVQGAIQLRRRVPQAVFIFLAPPSLTGLLKRLEARHTESPAELERRTRDAEFEMQQLPAYDYVVVNREGSLKHAVDDIACIITAERLRIHRQRIVL